MGIFSSQITVPSTVQLEGKVCVITGGNTGLGYISAKDIASRKAHVIIACRSKEKGDQAVSRIKQEIVSADPSRNPDDVKLEFMELDLASFKSIREFSENFIARKLPLHILMNNAGIMNTPYGKTLDGFESQTGVNHLGHFLLTNLLLGVLKESAPSRIINVSSSAHKMASTVEEADFNAVYSSYGWTAYGKSKLMNILFTYELARRLEGTGVVVNAIHPGFVATELGRHTTGGSWFQYIARTPETGAMTQIYMAVAPEAEKITGKYFADCKDTASTAVSYSKDVQKMLWDVSCKLTKLE